jgi:very-short-patch-repair endonuclease
MKELARGLRRNHTEAETKLWHALRNRQIKNSKFRRQQVLGSYIVDFICLDKNLVVELDGSQHTQSPVYDRKRTEFLRRRGFRILRFWNSQIFNEFEAVLQRIYDSL